MKLVIAADALKALLRMPARDAAGLREKLTLFAADPYGAHPWAKGFGGHSGRIRHGDWRAVYEINGTMVTVLIVKIGNRREVYR
jgi:mRNA interferase RelE/StbE